MHARLVLGAVIATLVVLALPAAAGACNEPTLGLTDTTLAAGDTTTYTISNLQPGGEYTLTVEGRVIASGVSTSEHGHSGTTAPMPDLGPAHKVSVNLHAIHNGPIEAGHETGPWDYPVNVEYGTQTAAAPATGQPAAEQPAARADERPAVAPAPASARPARPAARNTPAARSGVRPRSTGRAAARTAQRGARPQRAVPARAAVPETAPATARPATRAARASRARPAARTAARPAPARTLPAPRLSPRRVVAPSPVATADGRGIGDGLALALVLLLAHGAATLARMSRRLPAAALPDTAEFDALGIERELQEMIAAEREKATA